MRHAQAPAEIFRILKIDPYARKKTFELKIQTRLELEFSITRVTTERIVRCECAYFGIVDEDMYF